MSVQLLSNSEAKSTFMAKKETFHSLVTFILFAAVCLMGYLWFSGQLGPRAQVIGDNLGDGTSFLKTEGQFRDKLAELKMQRDKVQRGLKRLERLKGENLEYLKGKGIKSGDDFKNSSDVDVKNAMINLKEWVTNIKQIKSEVTYYDEAISSIQTMLDRIERERIDESIKMSDEESFELQKLLEDLGERLNNDPTVLEQDELGELLDLEMAGELDN